LGGGEGRKGKTDIPVSSTKAGTLRASVRTESSRLSEVKRRDMRGSGREVGNLGHIAVGGDGGLDMRKLEVGGYYIRSR